MCSGLSSAHGLKNEVCSCVVRFLRLWIKGRGMCSALSSAHEGPGNEIGGYVAA